MYFRGLSDFFFSLVKCYVKVEIGVSGAFPLVECLCFILFLPHFFFYLSEIIPLENLSTVSYKDSFSLTSLNVFFIYSIDYHDVEISPTRTDHLTNQLLIIPFSFDVTQV